MRLLVFQSLTDLEHLDERHAQTEVCEVGQDQTAREECADRQDRSHPLIALWCIMSEHNRCLRCTGTYRHLNLLGSINKICRPLQDSRADRLPRHQISIRFCIPRMALTAKAKWYVVRKTG